MNTIKQYSWATLYDFLKWEPHKSKLFTPEYWFSHQQLKERPEIEIEIETAVTWGKWYSRRRRINWARAKWHRCRVAVVAAANRERSSFHVSFFCYQLISLLWQVKSLVLFFITPYKTRFYPCLRYSVRLHV